MLAIVETMKIAFDGLTDSVKDFTKKINDEFGKLKPKLDNHVKRYNSPVRELFEVDTKRKRFFYLEIFGGIAKPIVLFLVLIFHVFVRQMNI